MNQFLKKKVAAGKQTGKTDEAGKKGKTKDKKADWSDDGEDDYNIDVQVNDKKMGESNKQAIVNIGSGWKEEDLKINEQQEEKKAAKKWGDSLKQTVNIDQEAFPTLGEAYV